MPPFRMEKQQKKKASVSEVLSTNFKKILWNLDMIHIKNLSLTAELQNIELDPSIKYTVIGEI